MARLITTSCFSRRSSSFMPMMQRTSRSLIRIRSIADLQKAPATVNEDDLAGHKIALEKIQDRVRDVPGPSVALERQRLRQPVQIRLVLPGGRKNKAGRYRVYRD